MICHHSPKAVTMGMVVFVLSTIKWVFFTPKILRNSHSTVINTILLTITSLEKPLQCLFIWEIYQFEKKNWGAMNKG